MGIFKKKNSVPEQGAPRAPMAAAAPLPPQRGANGYEALARKVSRFQIAVAVLAAACVALVGVCVAVNADATSRISSTFNGTSEVLVVNQTVPAGAEITADMLSVASVPNSQVVEGAVTKADVDDPSKSEIGSPIGKHAAAYMPRGAQVSASSIAWAANPSSLAAAIEAGHEAVSVSVDAQTGVGGMLHIGDSVRVITPTGDEIGGEGVTTVVESCRVAAIGADFSDGSTGDYSCVTLELSPADASRVKAAIAGKGVTLALASSANAGE